MKTFVEAMLALAGAYLGCGLLFAGWFQWRGLKGFDAGADGAGWGFRLLVTPGIVALWPLLAVKTRQVRRGLNPQGSPDAPIPPKSLRRWHGLAFKLLAVVISLVAGAALCFRPAQQPPRSALPAPPFVDR